MQEVAASVVNRNDAITGHIISTTIGGKNGEPKQVITVLETRKFIDRESVYCDVV